MDHPLMDRQIELEAEQRELTIDRINQRHDMAAARSDFSNSDAGRLSISTLMDTLTAGFTQWFEDVASGKPGKRCSAVKPILETTITPEVTAYLTFNAILDEIMKFRGENPATDARVAMAIGNRIHDELRLRHLPDDSKHLLKYWLQEASERSLTREKTREFIMKHMRNLEISWCYTDRNGFVWEEDVRQKLGRVILQKTISVTPICRLQLVRKRGGGKNYKRTSIVVPTDGFLEYLESAKEHIQDFHQTWLPTVVPPKKWDERSLHGGGYYTDNVPNYPLVKRLDEFYAKRLDGEDMSQVVKTVNAVQDTPWRINPTCLEALEHIYGLDREIAGLPYCNKQDIPPAPEEVSAAYRLECWKIHDKNRRDLTKRIFVTRLIQTAKKFSEFERIYFPHDMDNRGRLYPKPIYLNPQGPDFVKGLLEFAEGKALGTERAVYWLAIQLANCAGQDKAKLGARYEWTLANEEMILSVAENPLDDLRWTHVDEPFQFLQAAQAWAGYRREGLSYKCHVPIAVDATCSGLQHYSALLRDPKGGRAVNLMNLPDRQDVYGDVAERATEICKEYLGTDQHNLAQAWLDFGIDRKITKRSVMVVPYAATFNACLKYTREAYEEKLSKGHAQTYHGEDTVFLVFGARVIWQAISEVVVAATDAMQWIKAAVSQYSKNRENTYIDWRTPSGFLVRHRKPDLKQWRMDTILDGSRMQTTFYKPLAHLKPTKMASSTPPSFIHSLDAAHLVMSVCNSFDAGISDFAVVHDSFATHASDMDVFNQCIREAFHAMYADGSPLEELREQLQYGVSEPLPELPKCGDLDLDEVLESTFFFS